MVSGSSSAALAQRTRGTKTNADSATHGAMVERENFRRPTRPTTSSKGRIFQQMPQLLQIFRAERAVDHAMIAAHRDRHAMAHADLVAIVDHGPLRDRADGEDETLRRIDDGGKRIDPVAAQIRNRKGSALEFLRLHPLVPRAAREVFHRFADFAERLALRGANHGRDQAILDRDRDREIDILILHDRVVIEGSVHLRHFRPRHRPTPSARNRSP